MDLKTLAERVVALNLSGNYKGVLELYADNVVSVEAHPSEDDSREAHGVAGIEGKWAWWENSFEVHSSSASGPFLHFPDRFAVIFEMDVTNKATQTREQMREVALYTVATGKIVREEFFY
jgi:hypothetical protein